jgi:hypothetical protein
VSFGNGSAAKPFFHHRDHLKSIQLITDQAGAQTKRSTYQSYGDKGLESIVASHREEKGTPCRVFPGMAIA